MALDRQAVMAAVYGAVTGVAGIRTFGPELQHWSSVPAQPALFPGAVNEVENDGPSNLPPPVTYIVELWIYTRGDERADKDRRKALSVLQNAVSAVFAPSPITNTQTLGLPDQIINARIKWRDPTAPGHNEGQAVAVGEVEVFTYP